MVELVDPIERLLEEHGPLFLINLPERKDRHAEFGEQLARIGLSFGHPRIRTFHAIRPTELSGFPTIGARGCFLSHKTILERTVSDQLGSVIICEDDLDFAPSFLSRLPVILEVMAHETWDIFYAGYTSEQIGDVVNSKANIFRLPPMHPVMCAHFYILRGQAIADLHHYLNAILSRPSGHPDGGPMHYDGALSRFRASRPDLVTLATLPTLGKQRPSRTDIHALPWFDRTPLVREAVQILRMAKRR